MRMKGFVTIATGDEKYYKLAFNLLRSYKLRAVGENILPFAIICDRKNKYTEYFDDIIILPETETTRSFMDKLFLYRYTPYEETLFVDADSLFTGVPEGLWYDFRNADDVCCYGAPLPLDSTKGWFTYDGCKEYKNKIKFLISMHGGVYYFRKTDRARKIFDKAIELAENYSRYGFNYFDKPADEPVLAMAMAIFQCLPTQEKQHGGIMFVPSCFGKVKVNLRGDIYIKGQKDFSDVLVHFATPNTKLFTYKFAAYSDECNCYGRNKAARIIGYCKYRIQTFPQTCVSMIRHEAGRLIRKFYSENRKG